MAKKIFASARLVKSAKRWHIDFSVFDPVTGNSSRHRKDFDLNDIEDLSVREAVAQRIIRNIEVFAAPQVTPPLASGDPGIPVKKAVLIAVEAKQNLPRKSSRRRYITVGRALLRWTDRIRYSDLPLSEFTRKHARAYWDHLTAGNKYRGRTLNNYLDALRTLWNELIDREMLPDGANPWNRIKPAREEEKLRRIFTKAERLAVAEFAQKNDSWVFFGILLQYYCYIRPVELTRLKFRDFNFATGIITVRETDAKSYRRAPKTIPASVLPYFIEAGFDKYPANYFVFGLQKNGGQSFMAPSTEPINEGRLAKRHDKILTKMKDAGLLRDTNGLSWYSWKDTGISAHAAKAGAVQTRDQAAHRSLDITALYYAAPEVNTAYRDLENDLFF